MKAGFTRVTCDSEAGLAFCVLTLAHFFCYRGKCWHTKTGVGTPRCWHTKTGVGTVLAQCWHTNIRCWHARSRLISRCVWGPAALMVQGREIKQIYIQSERVRGGAVPTHTTSVYIVERRCRLAPPPYCSCRGYCCGGTRTAPLVNLLNVEPACPHRSSRILLP